MPRFVLSFPIKKPDCKVRLSREILFSANFFLTSSFIKLNSDRDTKKIQINKIQDKSYISFVVKIYTYKLPTTFFSNRPYRLPVAIVTVQFY